MNIYELIEYAGAPETTLFTDKAKALDRAEEIKRDAEGGTEIWLFIWGESERDGELEIKDSVKLFSK